MEAAANTTVIQLAVKVEINAQSSGEWEAEVFRESYAEFLVQAQGFKAVQPAVHTWSQMKQARPKANPAVPFKVGLPVVPLIQQLNQVIPGFTDVLNINPLRFASHYFYLKESHVSDARQHEVYVIFSSEPLYLHASYGSTLLLGKMQPQNNHTFMVALNHCVTICRYGITNPDTRQLLAAAYPAQPVA